VSHIVIYRGSDGQPGYHEAEDLGAAISYVEHLRNDEGVEAARICRMEEVRFEFRPYYRVSLGAAADRVPPAGLAAPAEQPAPAMAAPAPPVPPPPPAGDDVDVMWNAGATTEPAEPAPVAEPEPAGTTPRRGLFGR